jgi:hypothetical protein
MVHQSTLFVSQKLCRGNMPEAIIKMNQLLLKSMKNQLQILLFLFLLMGGARILSAQNAVQTIDYSPAVSPAPVYIYAGTSEEPIVWYVENAAISDQGGILVFEMKNASVESLFDRLETLGNEEEVTAFTSDRSSRTVRISMGNLEPPAVIAGVIGLLTESNR